VAGVRRKQTDTKPHAINDGLLSHQRGGQILLDAGAWVVAILAAALVQCDFRPNDLQVPSLAALTAAVLPVQMAMGTHQWLYRRRWRLGSFEEAAALARTTFGSTLVVGGCCLVLGSVTSLSVALGAGPIAVVLMAAKRFKLRHLAERRLRPAAQTLSRVVVIGAGEAGAQVVNAMLRSPDSPYDPVALIDDDPMRRNLRISGVPVLGTRADLPFVVDSLRADVVLIAVPSADAKLIRELCESASQLPVDIKVLPPVAHLFGSPVGVDDIRPITYADLLGRHQVHIDTDAVAHYLSGKRVLVTGAGGSIGSELCRQIAGYEPDELVMLDRDESALHALQLSLDGQALLQSRNLVIADIRDVQRLTGVFAEHKPDVVFHAAALKHVSFLEAYPDEALKSNVLGTMNVLNVATAFRVERFVNISTDKAVEPINVLGITKRIAERLTSWVGIGARGTFLSVRFGNVLGSRGSVLTSFTAQIEAGGPVTVTHPDVTRYFMTVEEAVLLVIQAGAVGRAGEVLVLDMGEPVSIAEVARRLIAAARRPVDITFTGLRPGEKLHETCLAADEPDNRPVHPLISHAQVPPLDPEELHRMDFTALPRELIEDMIKVVLSKESNDSVSEQRCNPREMSSAPFIDIS